LLLLAAGLATGSAALVVYTLSGPGPAPKPKEPVGAAWNYETVFPDWPKDRKPDFVVIISGQTYGYLQKCGCSDPQKGGLERRFNFIRGFKAHGIEAVPIDLGDLAPHVTEDAKLLHKQSVLKYGTSMRAMKAMGYRAVTLGKEEFALGLHEALGEFSLQNGNDEPALICANLIGMSAGNQTLAKKAAFPNAKGDNTAIHDWALIPTKTNINVGVVGIVGEPIIADINKIDPTMVFADTPKLNTKKAIENALAEMDKQKVKPGLRVLLYNGPLEVMKKDGVDELVVKAAKAFPQFRVIVCRSEESEPPNATLMITDNKIPGLNSMVVRVGHKGQNLGVVGVFGDGKGGYELHYQRVAMTPEFDTLPGKESDNIALKELEDYAKTVKQRGFLTMNRKQIHPLQVSNSQAKYVGSQACVICHKDHGDAGAVWTASKHANAYAALSQIAKRPSLREFDGECIRCHTVGYDYNTGFVDAVKTPQLMNVGCESCHGPGSQHLADPKNRALALELSPWKVNAVGKLPELKKFAAHNAEPNLAKKQKVFNQAEQQMILRVDQKCQTCHNPENDPHFKLEVFWPKVAHSLKPIGNGNQPAKGKDGEDASKKETGPALPTGPAIEPPKQ
jgi:hypothetical protein